jgi:multicomponent Na+:H+ antiporter subunit D
MSAELLLLLTVGTPLLAALLALLGPRRLAEWWSYPAAALTLYCALSLLFLVRGGGSAEVEVLPLLPGAPMVLRADALGVTFAALASALWVLATIYSSGYVRAERLHNQPRFFACFAASIGAATAIAYSGNLITFLLFYEFLTLTTYPLVVHKQTPEAIAGGRRYLAFAIFAGIVLTTAVVWTWLAAGTLDFQAGGFLVDKLSPASMSVLFALFITGCGVKAAIMPLHSWLPAAMVAPSPVSALLHAVAVVKAGVFGCIRVVGFVFGPEALSGTFVIHAVAALCAVTILVGSLLAVNQDHLKRRLAYSTVVHLSYIVLGAVLLAPYAMTGSILHLVNHGLAKITLFFCAGAIHANTHLEYISQMKGLGRRMPFTFGAFTVAALGLIGMPGLCGFVGKLFLLRGAVEAHELHYLALMLGASVFSAAYLLPIVRSAYFEEPDPLPAEGHGHGGGEHGHGAGAHGHGAHHGEAPRSLVGPLLGTAALVVVFGLVPFLIDVQFGLAAQVASQVFGRTP